MAKKSQQVYDEFYEYPQQFPQLGPVDPRLLGYSIADWFRSNISSTNRNLTDCLLRLYGQAAYHSLADHFGKASGYANQADWIQNSGKRNIIAEDLLTKFADYVPPGTPYPQ